MVTTIDAVALAQALVRCPSVTPVDAGALDIIQSTLSKLGFDCTRLTFGHAPMGPVDNLFAIFGSGGPHLCFAGHADVVPPGNVSQWSVDPFAATIAEGRLIGRGAADMKGAIAAFIAAAAHRLSRGFNGRLSLLITGDEEGPAEFGTAPVLEWMRAHGYVPDHCLVGEPTSARSLGDMIKIGRRGSLNAHLTVFGQQGHVAYPDLADNPITRLVHILDALKVRRLDNGTPHFQPSNLEITDISVGNHADNVIPQFAKARLNIRFNTEHSGASLSAWIKQIVTANAPEHELNIRVSGEAFLTQPGEWSRLVQRAVRDVSGTEPELSTTGGTSDARFITKLCPVVEFGLVGTSMHKANEQVPIADIDRLVQIYRHILERYFDVH